MSVVWGGSPKKLLGVEGGLPKKFFLICKLLIAPHHTNYECSLSRNVRPKCEVENWNYFLVESLFL
jgi:hypothetical protein